MNLLTKWQIIQIYIFWRGVGGGGMGGEEGEEVIFWQIGKESKSEKKLLGGELIGIRGMVGGGGWGRG